MAPPPPILFNQIGFIEALYVIATIVVCLLIYYKTKELYKLSQHQGIKYFRLTFLFFAISNAFKLLINYFREAYGSVFSMQAFPFNFSLIIIYTTSMAFLCLIHSLIWKKYNLKDNIYVLHTMALVITILAVIQRGREGMLFFVFIQIILFILALILNIIHLIKSKTHKKPKIKINIIYMLFLISWIISILATILSITISLFTGIIIYSISFTLLLVILIRIYKLIK
jgi:hypothetical protein